MQHTTEWLSSIDDHDCQEISAEKLSTDEDLLPEWFTQMHLTETQFDTKEDFFDHMLEIDHNLSFQCPTFAITYHTINEKPRPHFDLRPRRHEKLGRDDWRNIQKITGNAPDAIYSPPRQSTLNDSPSSQSTPKVKQHSKKLKAKRLQFDI